MIASAICNSFKREMLDGIHEPDDNYKVALFTKDATLGPATTSYAGQAGEVKGPGYTPGGMALSGRRCGLDGNAGYMTFANPRWSPATFTAHGALIYNASKQNRAIAVINFGEDYTSTNGAFVIGLPEAGAHAIVTFA
ncbi:MAG TPA: hypothetical protein VGG59_06100 [Acidobacteriaceae bacterium]|jgi:hypothetical protein